MIVFLLVFVVFATLATIIILFGDLPSLKNTFIYRLRHFILLHYRRLSLFLDKLDQRWFHGSMYKSAGWLVPFFYCSLLTYTISIFFVKSFHLYPYQSNFNSIFIPFSIFLLVSSTLLGIFSDPGEINYQNLNIANSYFQNNGIIFFKDKYCTTCELHKLPRQPDDALVWSKPARSKHCNVCNRCVMVMDHHCIWLNNCIGYYNYKWFIYFILSNLNFLIYGATLNYICLSNQLKDTNRWSLKNWVHLVSQNQPNKICGVFLIVCVIFIIIVSLFLAEHIRYLYLGITTNEMGKWSDLQYLVTINVLYKTIDFDEEYVERVLMFDKESNTYNTLYISLKNGKILDVNASNLRKVDNIDEIDNIYDLGFKKNVKFRLFPRNLSRF